jgi:hypothetical protein
VEEQQEEPGTRMVFDALGREIVVPPGGLGHVQERHPEVGEHDVLAAIPPADKRTRPRPGRRERLWATGVGPARYFVVVVEFDTAKSGRLVTAFASSKGPRQSELL